MTFQHMKSKEFLVGAAIGGLLGGTVALLSTPQSGHQLRRSMCSLCKGLSDKASDAIKSGKSLAGRAEGRSICNWADCAKSTLEKLGSLKEDWISEEGEEMVKDLLIGVAAGALVGALAGLLLAPKAGRELREDVSERAQDLIHEISKKGNEFAKKAKLKRDDWLDTVQELVEALTEEASEKKENLKEGVRHLAEKGDSRIQDLKEWISLGSHLWKAIKSNR